MAKYYLSVLTFTITLLVGLTGCNSDSDNQGESDYKLSILHVNDTHSHLTSEKMGVKIDGVKTDIQVGGYPRMVKKIDELKTVNPNTLILNAGDIFQGTLFYSLFKGEADAAAMNLIKWDAYELGNHAFDDGDEGLKKVLDLLDDDIPVIAANVIPQDGNILQNYWKPYVVKELGNEKVGIIGIDIVSKTKNSSNPSDTITFLDETTTAQKYIDQLKVKGVNKIVLLTHQGYLADIDMASKLNGVDIIVGGDSHTLIGDFSQIGIKSEYKDYPKITTSKDGKKVCIVQAWEYGHIVGNLNVDFDKNGDVISCGGNPFLLVGDKFVREDVEGKDKEVNASIKADILNTLSKYPNISITAEDQNALTAIKTFEDQVDVRKKLQIGVASTNLRLNRIPMEEYGGNDGLPYGSEITPIVAKSFYDLSNLADASIQNGGGVRISLRAGKITMGDAYALLPFSNTLYEIQMTGAQVKQVLEDSLNYIINENGSTGAFPYAYGLRYNVDMSAQPNNRISELEVKDRRTKVWSNIDLSKTYTIVTNSYTARGKDGYITFKAAQINNPGVDTYLDYAMSFLDYVQKLQNANKEVSKLPQEDICIKKFTSIDGSKKNF